MRFVIQLLLFFVVILFYCIKGEVTFQWNVAIILLPILLILMAGFALGLGMIISSLTTKYRDLAMFIGFGVGLLMYATPVIYPLNSVPVQYRYIVNANPITPIVETFRYAFLGSGSFNSMHLVYSFFLMIVCMFLGVIIFNKVEQNFMDTV
jgi:lipopolysaccharide transport system permease protein